MVFSTSAILLATFSLLVILLASPSLFWHLQHRNIGASFAIAWILGMNLIIFTNAIIWPNDDFANNSQGQIICDIQVKIQIASQVAFPASFACVLRALAKVMDVDHIVLSSSKAAKRREMLIDLMCCIVFPCIQMLFHYVVQASRYFILGVNGCLPTANNNWLTVLLLYIPPVLWDLVCACYAVVILYRLHKYKRDFRSILEARNTNRSRFWRLFLICMLWIVASVPIQVYIFYVNLSSPLDSYSWAESHDPGLLGQILQVPTYGGVVFDRFVWLCSGYAVFFCFGLGKDATRMYAQWLTVLQVPRLLPATLRARITRQRRHKASRSNGGTGRDLLHQAEVGTSSIDREEVELWDAGI